MYVTPVNYQIQNRKLMFQGNTSPKDLENARKAVIKALNMKTGNSFIVRYMNNTNDPERIQVYNDFFNELLKNIDLADTVEKLLLLKSYALSLVQDIKAKDFLKFLKSKYATDENIIFLQSATDVGYGERVVSMKNKGYVDAFCIDIFAPVFKYLSGKNKTPHFKSHNEYFEDLLSLRLGRIKRPEYLTSQDKFTLPFSKEETDIALNLARNHNHKENKISSQQLQTRNSYLSVTSGYNQDKTTGEEFIEICLEHLKSERLFSYDFLDGYINPRERQLFIRLDKNNKLLKVKMFNYYEELENKESPLRSMFCKDSAFVKYPDFIMNSLRNKYIAESIEYDANNEIVTYCNNLENASKAEGLESAKKFTKQYKLTNLPNDTKDFCYGSGSKKFTFSPLNPTASELYRIFKHTGENNLICAIESSNWKNAFIKLIEDGTL